MNQTLGGAFDILVTDIASKAQSDPSASYTAKLLAAGPAYCAKKLGEEGVELALAVVGGAREDIISEAADLLYHLAVALRVSGVSGEEVAVALEKRRGVSGLEEKAARQ